MEDMKKDVKETSKTLMQSVDLIERERMRDFFDRNPEMLEYIKQVKERIIRKKSSK